MILIIAINFIWLSLQAVSVFILEPVSELALLTVVVSAACECVHLGACE